jgi:hypothetical protein
MKTRLLFSALILGAGSSFAQLNQYQKSHDLGNDDYANKILYSSAIDGYLLVGSSNSNLSAGYHAALMFADNEGTLLTEGGQVGGALGETGRTLNISSTGETTVAGTTNSFSTDPTNSGDFIALHLDDQGEMAWLKVWGTDSVELGQVVIEANDGNVVMAGRSKRRHEQRTDALVVKLSVADGDTLWAREVGSPFINEMAYDLFPIGDGYVMVGWSGANVIGVNDALVVVLDENGDKQLAFFFGGPGEDDARVFVPGTSEGIFYISGNTRNIGAGGGEAYLAKFDASGGLPTMLWFKTYGGTSEESLQAAIAAEDGSILMVGTTNSFGNAQEAFIVKVDEDGVIQWSNVYGGAGNDYFQSITENDLAGFVAAGFTNSFGGTANDVYLVGIDAAGNSTCGQTSAAFVENSIASNVAYMDAIHTSLADVTATPVTLIDRNANPDFDQNNPTENILCLTIGVDGTDASAEDISVYPIPSNEFLNVNFPSAGSYTVSLYSVDGRLVHSAPFNGASARVDVQSLIDGMYLLELRNAESVWTSKVVKN